MPETYIPEKDDLVVEKAGEGIRLSQPPLAAFDEATGSSSDPWEHLTRIADRMLQGLVIHPEYMLVLTQSLVNQDTPVAAGKFVATLGQQVNSNLIELIEASQAAGQVVRGNPEELAMTFIATIQGLAITQFTQGIFIQSASSSNFLPSPATVLRLLKA